MLDLLRPVLSPTLPQLRRLALAGIVADVAIMSTGAAVRLSASGLGCPDWPRCSKADVVGGYVGGGQTLLNTWIEFGNRLLNFPLVAIAALIFIAAVRYRPAGAPGGSGGMASPQTGGHRGVGPRGLVLLGAIQPLGVIAQAVVGGIVVLTKLNPALVSVHFLLSISIVAAAVLLYARCTVFEEPPARGDLRILSAVLVAVTCAMVAAGTVVTGTGPLAGHADTPRYHLPLAGVTQLHADIGWLMSGLSVALLLGIRLSHAGPRALRAAWWVVGGLLVQGTLGYVQYFNHLPAGLVWVHVTTAVMLWVAVLWLFFTLSNGFRLDLGQVAVPQREPEPADR